MSSALPPENPDTALQLRALLDDALRYWEPRRIVYNLMLVAIVLGWLLLTWPHFRAALTLQALLLLFVLAVLANDNPLTGPSAREALPSRVTCVVTHRRDRRWDCTAGLICTPTITC